MEDLQASGKESSVSPFVFLQAYGTLFQDAGVPTNGETQQEAWHFMEALLRRLAEEETMGLGPDSTAPSLIKELFHVEKAKKVHQAQCSSSAMKALTMLQLECTNCKATKDMDNQDFVSLNVVLPPSNGVTTLEELIRRVRARVVLADYRCDCCEERDSTVEQHWLRKTSKYIIVQAPRVGSKWNKKGEYNKFKIHTKVAFPTEPLDLTDCFEDGADSTKCQYEVISIVEHNGNG